LIKVSPENLKAFGLAVKHALSLETWTLDELGAAIDPPVGKSFISKIEKGRKGALNSRTVGRFIKALEMDEACINKFWTRTRQTRVTKRQQSEMLTG
jgi:hypothetical protein